MPTIDISGMKMYYEIQGEGTPIILLHGGLGSSHQWKTIGPNMAADFQVFTVDSRGHGKSDNPSGYLSYQQMADDVAAFVKNLGIVKPFVAGWSDGGQIALELGMRYSDTFAGIVVGAAWYSLTQEITDFIGQFGFVGKNQVDHEHMRNVLESIGRLDEFANYHAGGLEQLFEVADALSVPWFTDLDYKPNDFAKIEIPSLILQGDKDPLPLIQAVNMFKQIPNAELSIMPNATHSLPSEYPAKFSDLVRDFVLRHLKDT